MKKISNNKVYDTETAKLRGRYWNGYSVNHINYLAEALYLKKTGEFFLHGQGKDKQEIIPLTYEEAREWAEERLTADKCEDIFGEVEENDGGWTPVHVYVKNNLADEIKKEKQERGLTIKDIVNTALRGYFKK